LRGLPRADLGVPSRFAVGLALRLASVMSLVLVFSTAAAVDLLATCFVEQRPPMIEAAGRLEWFAWHSLDVVPEWSVPRVLDWREPAGPVPWWSGVLLMLARLVAVLVIAVPIARVGRAARQTWPRWLTHTADPPIEESIRERRCRRTNPRPAPAPLVPHGVRDRKAETRFSPIWSPVPPPASDATSQNPGHPRVSI
jgi:hypothetical protein